jgi:hypothetical protein
MKNGNQIRKSVLSFEQRTSPPPSFEQEFPRQSFGDFPTQSAQFARIPSGNNINIDNDFDDSHINISRQTPPLITGNGPFHVGSGSMDFVNLSSDVVGPKPASSGGFFGSVMGMFAKGSAPTTEPKSNPATSYEPVIDEVPLLEELGINFKDIWQKKYFCLKSIFKNEKVIDTTTIWTWWSSKCRITTYSR